ncbi:MAG: hypothetical protein F6J97_16600 [Leptolyngbya sp. SIO4C1]|nr:hypothetical protein [Leptolyngbya sp. SIO4C1]
MTSDRISDRAVNHVFEKAFATVATLAVVSGIVAGFWILGTPGRQRAIASDRQRLSDLQSIAQELHWRAEEQSDFTLPDNLDSIQQRRDPITDRPYEYMRLSAQIYELCATFETDSSTYPLRNRNPEAEQWEHPMGRHCFELDVADLPNRFY